MKKRVPKAGKRVRERQPCSYCYESHKKTKVHNCHICRGPRSVSYRLPACWFGLYEHLWAQVGWFAFLRVFLAPLTPTSFLPSSSGFSELCLMSGCWSLRLLSSLADDNWARRCRTRIVPCWIFHFASVQYFLTLLPFLPFGTVMCILCYYMLEVHDLFFLFYRVW